MVDSGELREVIETVQKNYPNPISSPLDFSDSRRWKSKQVFVVYKRRYYCIAELQWLSFRFSFLVFTIVEFRLQYFPLHAHADLYILYLPSLYLCLGLIYKETNWPKGQVQLS